MATESLAPVAAITDLILGTLTIVLELNTQSPPFLNDSDEEIMVSVEVGMFKQTATAV